MTPRADRRRHPVRRPLEVGVAAAAAATALHAAPSAVVERWYSGGVYPSLQAWITPASNLLPFALFDVVVGAVCLAVLATWAHAARVGLRTRSVAPLVTSGVWTAAVFLVCYVWFLGAWGLNYRREPLDARLRLSALPPSAAEVTALLERAVVGANTDHAAAHRAGFPGPRDMPAALVSAVHLVEQRHGRSQATAPARPKWTVLAGYFRMAGVDGLTAPLLLETLLNPDLTAPERPFVLAHEWAHLAGYAAEADANFAAWLVTQHADIQSRYSGWLFLLGETAAQVPADSRRQTLAVLEDGPRRDLAAIAARARRRVDLVQRVGWRAYDGFLRSRGVEAGIRDYSRVVELIVRSERTPPSGAVR